jgi:hypothetical protein
MNILGPQVAAAIFTDTEKADEAWAALADAGIGAAIVTDPGMLGKFELSLMVERGDLEQAQTILAPLINP